MNIPGKARPLSFCVNRATGCGTVFGSLLRHRSGDRCFKPNAASQPESWVLQIRQPFSCAADWRVGWREDDEGGDGIGRTEWV